jgi:CRISPR system Cascade subunit CasD
MGAGGEQHDLLARLASQDMAVAAYGRSTLDGEALPREPLLRDFHMVGSGYDDKDPWQSLLIPKTNLGKKAVGGGTKMTYRYYLQEMAFAVALQVPDDLAEIFAEALKNPVWDLFLGRKCCVPTEFIFQGLFNDANQALLIAQDIATTKSRALSYQVKQGEHEGEVLTLNDVPLQFGVNKKYRDRRVTIIS